MSDCWKALIREGKAGAFRQFIALRHAENMHGMDTELSR